MTTFLRTHQTVSRFLIASIWVVVALSDLGGYRVVKCNIGLILQNHDSVPRLRRTHAAVPYLQ